MQLGRVSKGPDEFSPNLLGSQSKFRVQQDELKSEK